MRSDALRATFVTALLVLTVLLATLLTRQAVLADRDHRASGERVLGDYAVLGAEGAAARLQAALSSRFYPVLLASADLSPRSADAIDSIRAGATGVARHVASRLNRLARIDTVTGRVAYAGAPLAAADSSTLADSVRAVARALPPAAYIGMRLMSTANGVELLAFMPLRTVDSQVRFAALTVPFAELQALVSELIADETAIPQSVSRGKPVSDGVQVTVRSATAIIAQRGAVAYYRFRASRDLGPAYGGLQMEVTLSESLAPVLLTTTLPRRRAPIIFALYAAMAALIVATALQVRRERRVVRLRDDFVASVSHELRTPLAQIRLFAETLRLARVRSPEERDRSLAIVENESKRLEHLVRNLLHFSHAERGAVAINRERADVSALVRGVAADLTPLAERSGARLVAQTAPGVHAQVDAAAIRQVLVNLIDNALKYGRHGQTIALRVVIEGGACRIEVENEGESIPPAERALMWQRFWRGDSARRAGITGTGIGLAIVSDIVSLHAGTVHAENGDGGGTRIVVRLPGTDA